MTGYASFDDEMEENFDDVEMEEELDLSTSNSNIHFGEQNHTIVNNDDILFGVKENDNTSFL